MKAIFKYIWIGRGENLVMVTDYWLKLVTVTRVAGWPKSQASSCNRVAS
jgi:hypothetical protein